MADEGYTSRRNVISSFVSFTSGSYFMTMNAPAAMAYDQTQHLSILSNSQRLGLELVEVTIGNPPRMVLAVKSLDPFGYAAQQNIEPGYILPEYSSKKALIQRIQNGPYPIDLNFSNLAAGGDAISDLGKPIISAEDALKLSKTSPNDNAGSKKSATESEKGFSITTLKKPSQKMCPIQSRRGDLVEIKYVASYYFAGDDKKVVYDSSAQRGTGLPYQYVLGSGDMVPGVDLGLYEMCPGEIREIDIPKTLAYGDKGNKLFRIPGGARLSWEVELVTIDSVRFGDNDED